ncbi:MAG TPA: hypothetical protein VHA77_16375 [Xanthobacteraceae bacterium]|jgi:hypothetical protein|nr:hypothetical protein [Xanthobacteraceae bacterium]
MLLLKYGLVGLASVLWLSGLADQLHSWAMTGKYLVISAMIGLLAIL